MRGTAPVDEPIADVAELVRLDRSVFRAGAVVLKEPDRPDKVVDRCVAVDGRKLRAHILKEKADLQRAMLKNAADVQVICLARRADERAAFLFERNERAQARMRIDESQSETERVVHNAGMVSHHTFKGNVERSIGPRILKSERLVVISRTRRGQRADRIQSRGSFDFETAIHDAYRRGVEDGAAGAVHV